MRGDSTRTWSIARRAATTAVAVFAGLTFVVGCGSDKPADSGSPGNAAAGPSGSDQATTPDASGTTGTTGPGATSDPGAGGGGTGGGGGGTGGGTGGGGAGGGSAAPCALVTNEDANQALGLTANKSVESGTECLYESGGNAVMFSLTMEPYDKEMGNDLGTLPGVTKIDGLGDAAFKVSLGPNDTQFHVWTKGKYVALIVTKESGSTEASGRALLDKVLSRI